MLAELAQLRLEYWVLLLIAVVVIARTAVVQWRKVRRLESDLAFKCELLDHNCTIADIERLTRRREKLRTAPSPAEPSPVPMPPLAATETHLTWMSFGDWYKHGIGCVPVVVQLLIWLLYGFAWIPVLYLLCAFLRTTAQTSKRNPGSLLPTLVGAAFFVAVVFASISGLVLVCSRNPARPPEGDRLTPESWVVPVASGGDGSCRIIVGRDAFTQSSNLEMTALVIAQSNPESRLRVQINPDKYYLYSMSPGYVTAQLRATGGAGDFTVQVTALDRLNKRAVTTFTVQVRPGLSGDGGQFAPSGSLVAALGAGAVVEIPLIGNSLTGPVNNASQKEEVK